MAKGIPTVRATYKTCPSCVGMGIDLKTGRNCLNCAGFGFIKYVGEI